MDLVSLAKAFAKGSGLGAIDDLILFQTAGHISSLAEITSYTLHDNTFQFPQRPVFKLALQPG